MSEVVSYSVTEVFVEQPLALPGSANYMVGSRVTVIANWWNFPRGGVSMGRVWCQLGYPV